MFNTLAGKFGGFAGGGIQPGTILVGGVQYNLRDSPFAFQGSFVGWPSPAPGGLSTFTSVGEPFVAKFYVIGAGGGGGRGGNGFPGSDIPGSAGDTGTPSYVSSPSMSTLTATAGTGGAGGKGNNGGTGSGTGGGAGSGGPATGGDTNVTGSGGAGSAGASAGPDGSSSASSGSSGAAGTPSGSPIFPLFQANIPSGTGQNNNLGSQKYGVGDGGPGGTSSPNGGGGGAGGGGGGGYLEDTITITPGITYSVRVGLHGGGGSQPGYVSIEFVS